MNTTLNTSNQTVINAQDVDGIFNVVRNIVSEKTPTITEFIRIVDIVTESFASLHGNTNESTRSNNGTNLNVSSENTLIPEEVYKFEHLNRTPVVPVDQSVSADHIICLLDGKPFRMLKNHLMKSYGMTPAEYRAHFSLPADYPITAPTFSERRSEIAKELGLGKKYKRGSAKKNAEAKNARSDRATKNARSTSQKETATSQDAPKTKRKYTRKAKQEAA